MADAKGESADRKSRSKKMRAAAPARDVRRALLDAAEAILTERGLARASVDEIAKGARVSSEVFHAHFASKGALLRALAERFCEQAALAAQQATRTGIWSGTPPRDLVEVSVRSIVEVIFERGALVRAILAHGTIDPVVTTSISRIGADLSARLHPAFGECEPRPRIDARTLGIGLSIAAALAHQTLLLPDGWSGVRLTPRQVADEAVRAVCGYLGV